MDFFGGFFGHVAKAGGSGKDRDGKNRDSKDKKSKDVNFNEARSKTGEKELWQLDFWLYNDKENLQFCNPLIFNDEKSIKAANFNPSKETKVLIHSVHTSFLSEFPQNAKDAYLTNEFKSDYNVICVDWCELAQTIKLAFEDIIPHASLIGRRVGEFLLWLAKVTNLDLRKKVHIVGHGVGAHVAGDAGVAITTGGKELKRISALDPRGPGYHSGRFRSRRIRQGDALFIDVFHTDPLCLGCEPKCGDVDFYINNDSPVQPYFDENHYECQHAANRYLAQTIMRGPERTDVTTQATIMQGRDNGGYTGRLIMGEYCLPKTRGCYSVTYNVFE